MVVEIEQLDGLARKLVMSLLWTDVNKEINTRLKKTQKSTRLDGFRPGKVPFKIIENRYGQSIQHEVINHQALQTFHAIIAEQKISLAGVEKLEVLTQNNKDSNKINIAAIFEVMPEPIDLGDLSTKEVIKIVAEVTDKDVQKTLQAIQQQKIKYESVTRPAKKTDRALINFVGKIAGKIFTGGCVENHSIILGSNQMLSEFENGLIGLNIGQSKDVVVNFPKNYHNQEVAGQQAVFTITLQKLEKAIVPDMDANFAQSLGINDGNVKIMQQEVKINLSRELARRVDKVNTEAVISLLLESIKFDLPKVMVNKEIARLQDLTAQNYLRQGIKKDQIPETPQDLLRGQAEKSVHIGLILTQILAKESIVTTTEQVHAVIEDIAQSYEDPKEVVRYYLNNKEEYDKAKSVATEQNIVNFVLSKVKVKEVKQNFDELMKA